MPNLRKIMIPKPLEMNLQGVTQAYTFFSFVKHFMDTQPAYNDDAAGIKAALVLETRMSAAQEAANTLAESLAVKEDASQEELLAASLPKELTLDEPDWVRLNTTVQKPKKLRRQSDGQEVSGYPFTPARIFGGFVAAIEEAEKV